MGSLFFIKYCRSMEFDVANVIFAEKIVTCIFGGKGRNRTFRDTKQDIQNAKQDIDRSNESLVNNRWALLQIHACFLIP